jgi:hypothetical protein
MEEEIIDEPSHHPKGGRASRRGGRRRKPKGASAQPGREVGAQRLEELTRELFRLHDLNGNGLLEEIELVKLNEKIAILHHGNSTDTAEVRSKYRDLFRAKLDPNGQPVPYATFRRYAREYLDGLDADPEAQEMILEQFVAEAQSGRRAFELPSLVTESDFPFTGLLTCSTSGSGSAPITDSGSGREGTIAEVTQPSGPPCTLLEEISSKAGLANRVGQCSPAGAEPSLLYDGAVGKRSGADAATHTLTSCGHTRAVSGPAASGFAAVACCAVGQAQVSFDDCPVLDGTEGEYTTLPRDESVDERGSLLVRKQVMPLQKQAAASLPGSGAASAAATKDLDPQFASGGSCGDAPEDGAQPEKLRVEQRKIKLAADDIDLDDGSPRCNYGVPVECHLPTPGAETMAAGVAAGAQLLRGASAGPLAAYLPTGFAAA